MQLAAQQHSQFISPGLVRKFIVPVPWGERDMPQIVHEYMNCTWRRENMTLLEFLRKTRAQGQISQRYERLHRALKVQIPLKTWINAVPVHGETMVAAITNSRSNDRYFGQWLLLNVPFRNVDDLWHPGARLLPQNLRYLGLCLLKCPTYWRNGDNPAGEMEHEARKNLEIENFRSMLAARTDLVDAYLSGELLLSEQPSPALHGTASTSTGTITLAAEQQTIIQTIVSRVEAAMKAKWPDDADSLEAWNSWLNRTQCVPFQNTVSVVLGPAGSGKSTAVETALKQAVRNGAHVGVACPTGMLATQYKTRHPDLDIDTVHGMFAFHKMEVDTLDMMKPYDMLVIDEVGQLSTEQFERLLRLWDAADRRPALVFVGDFCQLTGVDGSTARESRRWPQMHIMQLREMRRCKCEKLKWKLQLLRSATPSKQQLKKILKNHRAPSDHQGSTAPTVQHVAKILRETPNTTFLTNTRKASSQLNQYAVESLFAESEPLGHIPCDPDDNNRNFQWHGHQQHQIAADPKWLVMYEGMRIRITSNEDKDRGFVNGMAATVQKMRKSGVQVITDSGTVLLIHPITREIATFYGVSKVTFYPLRPGYSTTLHKVQGATLQHITLWMDKPNVLAAMYVAMSRVQHDRDWRFIGSIGRQHCRPAKLS